MAARKANLIISLLLCICSALEEPDYKSPFTQEIKLQNGRTPFKLGNELKLLEHSSIISPGPGHEKCQLTAKFSPNQISYLGNGKLLMIRDSVTDFNIVDFKNCSSQVNTLICNGTRNYDELLDSNYKLMTIVTYNDMFDVFDHYQTTCMPCRYNDKGERLVVEHSLEKEPTGQNPQWAHQHDGYSLELIKDAFGVQNGYFYIFKYINGKSALKILDSNFKVVKQRLFDVEIEAHSLLQENLTVCYKVDSCRKSFTGFCYHVKCHLLDSNLNSTAEVELHKISTTSRDNKIWVDMNVRNVIGGGAMIALKFHFDRSQPVHHKDVFLQRIHSDGHVDKPIQFDSVDNDFVFMHDFTFDNGEYCLVTVNDYYSKGSYTLIKCLNPSPDQDSRW